MKASALALTELSAVCGTLRRADGSLRPCDLRRVFGRWRSCVRVGPSGRSASVRKKTRGPPYQCLFFLDFFVSCVRKKKTMVDVPRAPSR